MVFLLATSSNEETFLLFRGWAQLPSNLAQVSYFGSL